MRHGAFGDGLGRTFKQRNPPALFSSMAGGQILAATEVWFDGPGYGMTVPIPKDDAYLVGLQFRGMNEHELWLDGRSTRIGAFDKGTVAFRDLRRDPIAYMEEPFHSIQFYVPRQALMNVSEQLEYPPVDRLEFGPGEYREDPTLYHLGQSLLPAMRTGRAPDRLFIDHVLLAICSHVAATYGGVSLRQAVSPGGLAPWRKKAAMELMRENLATGISLADIATACGLSTCAFVRQFTMGVGCSPHQWMMLRKIDRAIDLMRNQTLSLAHIAMVCGFSDQSHFTRVFRTRMGVSPGAWRSRR
jgi:AraC family transcriptional regulator